MTVSPSRPPSLLELPSYLAGQVARLGHHALEAELAARDLLLGHHAILACLADFGPLWQQQLAERLDVDKSNLVGRIDHLERLGLLVRRKDPADRRRQHVTITPAGLGLARDLQATARRSQREAFASLPPGDLAELTRLLGAVLDAHDRGRAAQQGQAVTGATSR